MAKRVRYVPKAFGRKVETGKDALEAAACLLEEEGRWTVHSWYVGNKETGEQISDKPSTPFCGNWAVCADGALRAVTVGFEAQTTHPEDSQGWVPDENCTCEMCVATRTGQPVTRWNHRWDRNAPKGAKAYDAARDAWVAYSDDDFPHGFGRLTQFNDAQPMSKPESRDKVVDAMRRVAASMDV